VSKTTYKVVGTREYLGHAPGSVFEADIEPESEARAIAAGHIAKSTAATKEADPVLTPAAAASAEEYAAVAKRQAEITKGQVT